MKSYLLFLSMLALVVFSACEKEDQDTPPEISKLEALNHDNETNVIERGGTIMVNFDARSRNDGRLDRYHIEIHDHPESGNPADEYKLIDDTFEDNPTFKGLRNASIHHHVSVPMDANLGEYHVVVVVIDEFGNSTDTEEWDVEVVIVE